MKKLHLSMALLCLLFSNVLLAQSDSSEAAEFVNQISKNHQDMFDQVASNLDKSKVPHGILYDRVAGWSHLDTWNPERDRSTPYSLYQSWWDIEQSYVHGQTKRYESMRNHVLEYANHAKVPVLVNMANFSTIDPKAIERGDLYKQSGQWYEKNSNEGLYEQHSYQSAALAISEIYSNSERLICFEQDFMLNNSDVKIKTLLLENTSTGFKCVLTQGDAVKVNFDREGVNNFVFKATLENGSVILLGQQNINVLAMKNYGWHPTCFPSNQLVSSVIPYQGLGEAEATTTHADYHIYYHFLSPTSTTCEKVLKKPIIILDGFDPLDGHPLGTLGSNNTTANYRDYLNFYDFNFINFDIPGSSLGEEYRKKGYDIIVLNFPALGAIIKSYDASIPDLGIPVHVTNQIGALVNKSGRVGGADFVQRNAFVLVKLIQEINAQLVLNGSAEKIVIVGPSMGGQVSRYALAYMEKMQALGIPNMNHNCRLWVSFDSPHEGANITLGAQQAVYTFGYLDGSQQAKDMYDVMLKSNAAKQFLIDQDMSTLNTNYMNGTSPFFVNYYQDLKANGLLNSNGFPMNCRKVSWSNGSGAGQLNGIAGQGALNVKAYKNTALLGSIKGFQVDTRFKGNQNQSVETFYRYMKLGLLSSTSISFNNTNSSTKGSLDIAPGGTHLTIDAIKSSIDQSLNQSIASGDLTFYNYSAFKPEACFIPAISSLAFKNTNVNWQQILNNRNLVCTSEIPFDGYFHPVQNEPHSYIESESASWLQQEVDFGLPGCPQICNSLSGPSSITLQGSSTLYAFNLTSAVPAGSQVVWTWGPGLSIAYTSGNTAYFTTQCTNENNTWVQAKIIPKIGTPLKQCGSATVLKKSNIVVTNPVLQANYTIGRTTGTNCLNTYTISPVQAGYSYQMTYTWYNPVNGGNPPVPNFTGSPYTTSLTNIYDNYLQVSAKITAGCGLSTTVSQYFSKYNLACRTADENALGTEENPDESFTAYPNPSSKYWNIRCNNCVSKHLRFKLTNAAGSIMNEQEIELGRVQIFTLDNTNLSEGVYYLEILAGNMRKTIKLIK